MRKEKSFAPVLERREDEVHVRKPMLPPQETLPLFEFIIRADEREIWRGVELDERMPDILREHPNAQIAIDWEVSSSFVLI